MEGEKDPHNCVQEVRQKTIVVYHVSVCDYRLCTIVREEEIGVYCVLCGNWNKIVSYHRFPKDRHSREKWLSFCGIGEKDLNTATFLCSNYFKEEDLTKRINCVIINRGAIPSIKTQKRKKRSNTTDDKYQPLMKKHNLDEMSVACTSSDNSQTAANTVSTLIEVNCQTSPRTPPRTTPVLEPRYVGDIRTSHLATPRRAKRAIALTRRVISQHTRTIAAVTKQITCAHKKHKRLINRVESKEFNF
ncbi:uncharacterized protein LOC105285358 isoform X3 [Ooceraea biroi]|uniref:uncharacterized protein LOC105285358 isoform X3 n=1 Tax=Ooceraea biroi TaxID=2015173 RepID=UPI000F085687|nr:uncharacterized protein LOC105285358 isoform X3 [Ooceraea biroi]